MNSKEVAAAILAQTHMLVKTSIEAQGISANSSKLLFIKVQGVKKKKADISKELNTLYKKYLASIKQADS